MIHHIINRLSKIKSLELADNIKNLAIYAITKLIQGFNSIYLLINQGVKYCGNQIRSNIQLANSIK